ncbi:MAG: type II secretion system protein [Clostridia bacterium]|nr:type II secretion system protein [Clostridia bacterium]
MKTKGFTLVELLVVIAILAILATVSVVGYTSFIDRAEQSNADTEAHQIETTIESYLIAGQPYELGKVDNVTVYLVVKNDAIGLYTDKEGTTAFAGTLGEVTGNDDFAGLGTVTVVSATSLTYTAENGKTATINLDK